jgi:hypothetical protein
MKELLELDESKDIIKLYNIPLSEINTRIHFAIKQSEFKVKYAHDNQIKILSKKYNIPFMEMEKLYQAVRYFEIQP